jgi:solute carrier family 25 2-oxodicarboxylate transporter 21
MLPGPLWLCQSSWSRLGCKVRSIASWTSHYDPVLTATADKAQAANYSGPLDVVRKIVKAEGPLALYQGLESTMWRYIFWNSGYFGCIFQVRAMLPANPTGDKSIQVRNDLISGDILNTPLDVVKSRIQNTTKVPGVTPKYNWAFPALGTVLKEEGFGALYKGFIHKTLRRKMHCGVEKYGNL